MGLSIHYNGTISEYSLVGELVGELVDEVEDICSEPVAISQKKIFYGTGSE